VGGAGGGQPTFCSHTCTSSPVIRFDDVLGEELVVEVALI
jgi:hypothetical protein